MDHQATQQQVVAMAGQQSQAPYGAMPQNSPLQTGLPSAANPSPQAMAAGAQPPPVAYQSAISYPHPHLQQQQHQQQQMQAFWMGQMQEIERVTDFKNHQLPLARIKKIMKADEDVRMISAEAPVVFAKACEMFILELTLRSWIHTEENKRRTLQKNDIAAAITGTDIFDFLVDIVPRDEVKEDGLGITPAHSASYGGLYYVPQPQPQGAPALPQPMPMMVGRPALMADPSMYTQQTRPPSIPYTPQQMWQQPMGNPIPGLPPSSC